MGWLQDLIRGIGDAISGALSSTWNGISDSIWGKFMSFIYSMVYEALADFFTLMTEIGANLFDLGWVKAALHFFNLFGWGLFVAGLIVAIFDTAIEYQTMGRLNIKKQILPFLYGLLAVNLFTTVPVELFRFSVNLQNTFAKDLANEAITMNLDIQHMALKVLTSFQIPAYGSHNVLLNLLILICLGYCVIKCFFSNIKRGGILLTQIAVGSLYLFSLPRGLTEGFTGWAKQIVALCITTFMQTTLLLMGLITMETHPLLGLGVMLSANEVPRIAQHFGLDTSTRVNMMSAVHTTETFPFKRKKNYGEVDAYYVEDSHPAIIDKATFEAAQALRLARRPKNADMISSPVPLSGKIKCAKCGSTFRQINIGETRYWGCGTYYNDTRKCDVKKIPESEIYSAFVTLYNKLRQNKKVILQPVITQLVSLKSSIMAQSREFVGIDEKIMIINDQLAMMAQLRQNGLMDEQTFRSKSNELNNSLNSLRSKRRLFLNHNEADKAITSIKSLMNILDKGPDKLIAFDEELYESMVKGITADDSGIIKFTLIGGLVINEKIERKTRK